MDDQDKKKLPEKYQKNYSEESFWLKIKKHANKIGKGMFYNSLLLFYASQRKDIPVWAKTTIYGALGYFISLFDAIPDFTPFLGYTDDVAIISAAIATVISYIDDEVKKKAADRFKNILGEDYQESEKDPS